MDSINIIKAIKYIIEIDLTLIKLIFLNVTENIKLKKMYSCICDSLYTPVEQLCLRAGVVNFGLRANVTESGFCESSAMGTGSGIIAWV